MESKKQASKVSKKEAINILWNKGVLVWKLNTAQRILYDTFKKSEYKIPVFLVCRRGGKSYTLLTIALEYCLQNPGVTVHYACPTAVMAQKIVVPTIRELLKDCPVELKPEYRKHDRSFEFPHNDSKIQIEGVDEGNSERLRGSSTHLGIVDEAGFVSDLEYLVNDILLPQTLTTNGRLLLSSTPPKSPGHSFNKFVEKAKKHNSLVKLPITKVLELIKDDPPHLRNHLPPKTVEDLKETSGGENSPTWRREYLVETIIDTTLAVVPEFTDEIEKEIVKEWPRPKYFDAYTSMDPGLIDGTGILYAYYDFMQAKLIIEDESYIKGNDLTTEDLAKVITSKEDMLWKNRGDTNESFGELYLRVSDNNELILLNDLAKDYKLYFIPTQKDDKESAVNDLRVKIANKKIIINPKCKHLIYQLRTALWAKNRKTFVRTEEAGHFDVLDALVYLVRNVQFNKNPYKPHKLDIGTHHLGRNINELDPLNRSILKMFSRNKGNK